MESGAARGGGIAGGLEGVQEEEQRCGQKAREEYSFNSKPALPHRTDLFVKLSDVLTHRILCYFCGVFHLSSPLSCTNPHELCTRLTFLNNCAFP